jgi:hypothetical protein
MPCSDGEFGPYLVERPCRGWRRFGTARGTKGGAGRGPTHWSSFQEPEGCADAFMQLAGTRGAGHRAGLVDTGCSRHPRRRSSVRWLGPAPGAAAPGVPGAGCSARRRPEDLLQGASPNDQQPVQALRADSTDPPLRVGVRVRRLHRGHEHLDTLRPKHVIEPAAELRVSIANEEAHPASSFVQGQQQVARLLGDPGGIGIGGHAGQVDPVKQSQATIPAACWRSNACQVVAARGGAGSSPWRRSVVGIAVAETCMPSCWSSPWMRW